MTDKRKSAARNDIILAAVLLFAALVALLAYTCLRPSGSSAVVIIDGVREASYPLSNDVRVELVTGENGEGRNLLVIENGKARIESASCPDLICAKHSPVDQVGDTIVCLPNRLVIEIE